MLLKSIVPKCNKVHNSFKLNGVKYSQEELKETAYSFIKEGLPYEKGIGNFLLDWFDTKEYLIVSTSGSTGIPKHIKINKQSMVISAIATGNFFNLKPGDKALHCLPIKFIAGKMMLVRALILGLELDVVEPSSAPVFDNQKHYDFCALIPMQLAMVYNNLNNISTVIIGGAPIPKLLLKEIEHLNSHVYETYGMTETLTHVAAKKLNNHSLLEESIIKQSTNSYFRTLPNIKIFQDERDCLVLEAPQFSEKRIVTNDIVKIYSENTFEWLGRFDTIINSGGIKIYPEQIEAKLQEKIDNRFFIASEADEILGERIVLIVEANDNCIEKSVFSDLNKHEVPKQIYVVKQFTETSSGKVQRKKTLDSIKK